MALDCITIVNRSGLTIHTSDYAGIPGVVLGAGETSIRRDAWEYTLLCDPGLALLDLVAVVPSVEGCAEIVSEETASAEPVSAEPTTRKRRR